MPTPPYPCLLEAVMAEISLDATLIQPPSLVIPLSDKYVEGNITYATLVNTYR